MTPRHRKYQCACCSNSQVLTLLGFCPNSVILFRRNSFLLIVAGECIWQRTPDIHAFNGVAWELIFTAILLITMAFYDVYSHPALIRHRTRVCTRATLFVCVVLCLTYISPLLVAYRSQGKAAFYSKQIISKDHVITWSVSALWTGFWLKRSTYEEQAVIQFQYDMIVIGATDTAGTYIAWSTFPNFNRLMGDNLRIPSVSVRTKLLKYKLFMALIFALLQ